MKLAFCESVALLAPRAVSNSTHNPGRPGGIIASLAWVPHDLNAPRIAVKAADILNP